MCMFLRKRRGQNTIHTTPAKYLSFHSQPATSEMRSYHSLLQYWPHHNVILTSLCGYFNLRLYSCYAFSAVDIYTPRSLWSPKFGAYKHFQFFFPFEIPKSSCDEASLVLHHRNIPSSAKVIFLSFRLARICDRSSILAQVVFYVAILLLISVDL